MNNVILGQFLERYPEECAREVEQFSLENILCFLDSLTITQASLLLNHVLPSITAAYLQHALLSRSVELVNNLSLFTLQRVMPHVNKSLRETLILTLAKNQQVALKEGLSFSMQTVGAFMNTHVLFLPHTYHIKQALTLIQQFPEEITPLLFCIDHEGKLQGMVSVQALICTPHMNTLHHIMQACPLVLPASTVLRSILTHSVWTHASILPIVDEHNVLLGALEFEKIIPHLQDFLFHQRDDSLIESLSHILFMFSHTTEDILNAINNYLPGSSPKDKNK